MNVFSACVKSRLAAGTAMLRAALLPLVSLLLPLVAQATEQTEAIAESSPLAIDPMASAGKVVVFLLLIIGLILLLAWLSGKTRGLPLAGFAASDAPLKTIATLPLSMKEKIAVIQVGEKQLVVGITQQQITCLAELDEPLPVNNPTQSPAFSELLKKAIRS